MTPTPTRSFSVDVEAHRINAGIPLYQLAIKSGISRTTLRAKIEHPGKFTLDEMAVIADILGIPEVALAAQ